MNRTPCSKYTVVYMLLFAFRSLIHFKALHESYNLCVSGLCSWFSESSKRHVNHVFFSASVFLTPSRWWTALGIRSPLCPSLWGFPISFFPWSHLNQVSDAHPQHNNERRFISPNCECFISIFKGRPPPRQDQSVTASHISFLSELTHLKVLSLCVGCNFSQPRTFYSPDPDKNAVVIQLCFSLLNWIAAFKMVKRAWPLGDEQTQAAGRAATDPG